MRRPSVDPPSGGAPICFSPVTGDFAADAASAPAIVCRPTDSKFRGRNARRTQSPVQSIMKMKKVKFYATLRGEGLIAALPHTPFC